MSASDLALLGELYVRRGRWGERQLVSEEWMDATWTPCQLKPEYGFMWLLNDSCQVFPTFPHT